ncbi:hypothetical protein QJS04_geneDACA014657 [Acorus gramineus]|uniref:DUF4283 domain-containing protein n=1 Tax=Acorus gramineus TaxID=55184 RepID=A0AAV9B6D6_ACOGR|nr:hypothetical protein QJS04_geneDACA014657 [Acorus gramineus]
MAPLPLAHPLLLISPLSSLGVPTSLVALLVLGGALVHILRLPLLRWESLFLLGKAYSPTLLPPPPGERSLSFVPPRVDEAEAVAVLNPSSYAPLIQIWENAVVGYIIVKDSGLLPVCLFLRKLWKSKGDFSLLLHANGFFIVRFDLAEDCNLILEGGPWTMEHRPFILKKWSPDVRMEQERLSSIPIWARIPNLPLHLWNSDCLSHIGSLIETPLFMDSATLRCSKTTFARLCIEASKLLPDTITVETSPGFKERFRVEYDWKPQACQFCKTFGHDEN